jgi:catechol-2,3-dioxygenase
MTSPVKLSHYVLQTNQIAVMRDWYRMVLEADVVHENHMLCFLSYDEEHHRIAFLDPGPLDRRQPARDALRAGEQPGLHHVAFTFASLAELLAAWERAKSNGVRPHWCINHGPTTSMYFRDPDGNGVELQVDNFADLAACKAYMQGPDFASNPVGVEFDPEEHAHRLRAGVPERELLDISRMAKPLESAG